MAGHDCQHVSSDRITGANDFHLRTGNPQFAELPQGRLNRAVRRCRPFTVYNVCHHVQEPNAFFSRFDPKCGENWIAIGGESLDKPSSVVNLILYQRALIHGNTSFSIAL
jgi:hypothetical protein